MSADIKVGNATINALIVAFKEDIDIEESELLRKLILQLEKVSNVSLHEVSISDYVATQRIKSELRDKVLEIVL